MRINSLKQNQRAGFTLIEMIGVLAVIAILAAVLIPKVFEAISNSRINNAAMSCQTVKTAIADHYAKFGSLVSSNGLATLTTTAPGITNYDQILLIEGFLDKLFLTKISATNVARVISSDAAGTAVTPTSAGYDLDGTTGNKASGVIADCILYGVTANDAKDLNDRIDGASLGAALAAEDIKGRVKFAAGQVTEVHVYLTHR